MNPQLITPIDHPLYCVTIITNPQRYVSRYKHYLAFEKHMKESGVILYTIELALRDRAHEITSKDNPYHIQLRSNTELWHKENLINLGVSKFPQDWKYGMYFDADFLNTRPDWANETLHQLQHYKWVQPFSTYSNLNKDFTPANGNLYSFTKVYKDKLNPPNGIPQLIKDGTYWAKHGLGAPGGAWAFRREAWEDVGGLLDICILGSGDLHMAIGLANIQNYQHFDLININDYYLRAIRIWQERANETIKGNIGYVDNHMVHFYHGSTNNRQYGSRSDILKKHDFNPYTDLKRDWQGIYSFIGNKPGLEEDIRQYFKNRNEDE